MKNSKYIKVSLLNLKYFQVWRKVRLLNFLCVLFYEGSVKLCSGSILWGCSISHKNIHLTKTANLFLKTFINNIFFK